MLRLKVPQVKSVGNSSKKRRKDQGGLGDAQEHAQISGRGQQSCGSARLVGLHLAKNRGAVWRKKQGLAQAHQYQLSGNNERRGLGLNRGEQKDPQGGDAQTQGAEKPGADIIGKPASEGRDHQD